MDYQDYFEKGKNLAEQIWKENTPSSTQELVEFFEYLKSKFSSMYGEEMNGQIDGACSFIFDKELETLDIERFNSSFNTLKELDDYEDCLYFIEELLPKLPDQDCCVGPSIEFQRDQRPLIFDNGITGRIGKIYWKNMGMYDWQPNCDIYDEIDPDYLLEEGCQLFYCSFSVSEVLAAIQAVVDPNHKNYILSDTISKSREIENKESSELYNVFYKNELPVISFKKCDRPPKYLDKFAGNITNIFLTTNGAVNAYVDDVDADVFGYSSAIIRPSTLNIELIVEDIKAFVNNSKRKETSSQ